MGSSPEPVPSGIGPWWPGTPPGAPPGRQCQGELGCREYGSEFWRGSMQGGAIVSGEVRNVTHITSGPVPLPHLEQGPAGCAPLG
jgi:hypothetical protein